MDMNYCVPKAEVEERHHNMAWVKRERWLTCWAFCSPAVSVLTYMLAHFYRFLPLQLVKSYAKDMTANNNGQNMTKGLWILIWTEQNRTHLHKTPFVQQVWNAMKCSHTFTQSMEDIMTKEKLSRTSVPGLASQGETVAHDACIILLICSSIINYPAFSLNFCLCCVLGQWCGTWETGVPCIILLEGVLECPSPVTTEPEPRGP